MSGYKTSFKRCYGDYGINTDTLLSSGSFSKSIKLGSSILTVVIDRDNRNILGLVSANKDENFEKFNYHSPFITIAQLQSAIGSHDIIDLVKIDESRVFLSWYESGDSAIYAIVVKVNNGTISTGYKETIFQQTDDESYAGCLSKSCLISSNKIFVPVSISNRKAGNPKYDRAYALVCVIDDMVIDKGDLHLLKDSDYCFTDNGGYSEKLDNNKVILCYNSPESGINIMKLSISDQAITKDSDINVSTTGSVMDSVPVFINNNEILAVFSRYGIEKEDVRLIKTDGSQTETSKIILDNIQFHYVQEILKLSEDTLFLACRNDTMIDGRIIKINGTNLDYNLRTSITDNYNSIYNFNFVKYSDELPFTIFMFYSNYYFKENREYNTLSVASLQVVSDSVNLSKVTTETGTIIGIVKSFNNETMTAEVYK